LAGRFIRQLQRQRPFGGSGGAPTGDLEQQNESENKVFLQ
jgi:hypothetical protein